MLAFQTPHNPKGPWANLTECRRNGQEKSSLYFGGIYSSTSINALTKNSTCPKYFSPQPLFDCLKNTICLSVDPRAISRAVPFGGFISSCMTQMDQYCMSGYTKVRINTYNNCTLYYCAQLKSWTRSEIVMPPFSSKAPPQLKVGWSLF